MLSVGVPDVAGGSARLRSVTPTLVHKGPSNSAGLRPRWRGYHLAGGVSAGAMARRASTSRASRQMRLSDHDRLGP